MASGSQAEECSWARRPRQRTRARAVPMAQPRTSGTALLHSRRFRQRHLRPDRSRFHVRSRTHLMERTARVKPRARRRNRTREALRSVNAVAAIQWIIPIAGLAAVAFAGYLARNVLRRDTGTDAMRDVASTINEGAVAFIRRQYTTIGVLAVVGSVVIGLVIYFVETPSVADVPSLAGLPIALMTAVAFLVGAACSMASGIIGMYISVKSNVRTAAAARRSLVEAVQVAMRGGAVSGFLVVALSLLGVYGIFSPFGGLNPTTVRQAP